MKISFIKPTDLEKKYRISVHKSGKLGFTAEAEKALRLAQEKSVSIGTNEDDPSDGNLYMLVHDKVEQDAFKLVRSGGYYSLNLKLLFDKLGYNYQEGNVSFDMERLSGEMDGYFKLTSIERKTKEEKEEKKEKEVEGSSEE